MQSIYTGLDQDEERNYIYLNMMHYYDIINGGTIEEAKILDAYKMIANALFTRFTQLGGYEAQTAYEQMIAEKTGELDLPEETDSDCPCS